MLSKGVEAAIRDAMERGDFDQEPGARKRVDLSAYFEAPGALRLAHSKPRNAGLLPKAAVLLQEISVLHEQARVATHDAQRRSAA